MADLLGISDQDSAAYGQLSGFSGRVATLLELPGIHSESPLLACLDDLLGAVYSLFYAIHHGYADRTGPLTPADINAVLVRARDMTDRRVRTEGKWAAGYYFNSALFRIASVYHRVLKIVVGNQGDKFETLVCCTRARFKSSRKFDWVSGALEKVNGEVNGLKHTPEGIFTGRNVAFADAILAIEELLVLIEWHNQIRSRHTPSHSEEPQ